MQTALAVGKRKLIDENAFPWRQVRAAILPQEMPVTSDKLRKAGDLLDDLIYPSEQMESMPYPHPTGYTRRWSRTRQPGPLERRGSVIITVTNTGTGLDVPSHSYT